MYYENENIIVDKNVADKSYIIDVDSGFKAEFNIIRGIVYCWPYKITRRDIERAERDNVDISKTKYPFAGYSCQEVKNICKKIEDFFMLSKYSSKTLEKVRFNFI